MNIIKECLECISRYINTLCYKCILGLRMLLKDMKCGMAQTSPTHIYTDSLAVEQGTICEKVSKISRWMAQIFLAIIDGSAYTDQDMQAFTLPQESPAA